MERGLQAAYTAAVSKCEPIQNHLRGPTVFLVKLVCVKSLIFNILDDTDTSWTCFENQGSNAGLQLGKWEHENSYSKS